MGRYEEMKKKGEAKTLEEIKKRNEARAKKKRENWAKAQREYKRNKECAEVLADGPYVSEALAKKAHGHWDEHNVERHLNNMGVKQRSVDGVPLIEAHAFAGLAASGRLGSNHTSVFNIMTYYDVSDLDEPEDLIEKRGNKIVKKAPSKRFKITEKYMRDKFKKACQALEKATDAPFNDQPSEVRAAAWAAKDGEPFNEPEECLEDCFPLEMGRRTYFETPLWICRAAEEDGQDSGAGDSDGEDE